MDYQNLTAEDMNAIKALGESMERERASKPRFDSSARHVFSRADAPAAPTVTICEYFHHAGPMFGLVDQIGTDDYLNAGALVNLENFERDVRAMRIFAVDKFAAAEREAARLYGWQPLVESD